MLDKRTLDYLNGLKKKLNFIKEENSQEFKQLTDPEEFFSLYIRANTSEIGKTDDGLWCVQLAYPVGDDDFNIEHFYFTEKPTIDDIRLIRLINDLEIDFKLNIKDVHFTCWECGRKTHWLDTTGEFKEKLDHLQEKYCGC